MKMIKTFIAAIAMVAATVASAQYVGPVRPVGSPGYYQNGYHGHNHGYHNGHQNRRNHHSRGGCDVQCGIAIAGSIVIGSVIASEIERNRQAQIPQPVYQYPVPQPIYQPMPQERAPEVIYVPNGGVVIIQR